MSTATVWLARASRNCWPACPSGRPCSRKPTLTDRGIASVSTLLILGAGGHGRVVADAALEQGAWQGVRATDRDPARCIGELISGVPLQPLHEAVSSGAEVHVAIGNGGARRAESALITASRLTSVVHPGASVSAHAKLGPGCFVAAQAVVAAGARIGAGVIVNHAAVVDHDVEVGDFSHIAPRATLGGGVRVGSDVLVGSGATVLPGLSICDSTVVGAGAVVTASIAQAGVYTGIPARRKK
ncbi:MAG: sugar O-acyltransferase [Haliea sp.]|nr:MAG: sugar O-acyltransferase [Haliea sp.]